MAKYILAATAVLLLCALPARAADEKNADATWAMLDLFKQTCFSNVDNLDKAKEFLDATYKRVAEDRKQDYLKYISTADGDAWNADRAEGKYVVMLESKGRCHVLADTADDQMLHKKMIAFAIETQKAIAPKIVSRYELMRQGELDMSGFRVREADGRDVYIVMASTKPGASALKEPAGIITLEIAPKK